jgi:hypothetical protein
MHCCITEIRGLTPHKYSNLERLNVKSKNGQSQWVASHPNLIDTKPAKVLIEPPPSSSLSNTFPRTHTQFTRPRLSKTIPPHYPSFTPDRQIRGSRLSFSAFAPHVFFNVSTNPVSQSFPRSFDHAAKRGVRPSQVIQSFQLLDCSLNSIGWLRLPFARFRGSKFREPPLNRPNITVTL